ncbi:MAG: hypothetical protein GXO82_02185 [Chlorobi bacterium]|nr:hypothetical protein [Chlorobiota bacterium]
MSSIQDLQQIIYTKKPTMIFLDYDRALKPKVSSTDAVMAQFRLQRQFERLSYNDRYVIHIFSDGPARDLAEQIGINKFVYIGRSGIEAVTKDGYLIQEEVRARRAELEEMLEMMKSDLDKLGNVEISDRGYLIRFKSSGNANGGSLVELLSAIRPSVKTPEWSLYNVPGGIELRSKLQWDKSHMVRFWLQQGNGERSATMYVGGGISDESAFSYLAEGITIRMGNRKKSTAKFILHDIEELIQIIEDM